MKIITSLLTSRKKQEVKGKSPKLNNVDNTNNNKDLKNLYNSNIGMLLTFKGNIINNNYSEDFKDTLEQFYRFTPDKYQITAAKGIYDNKNVVVTAPTGTGKTLIAEYAIQKNLKEQKKVFYTTPLKALTNQKYTDFCKLYGKNNVGLMTGDIKHNTKAPLVVMTTEVYRNMLWSAFLKPKENSLSDLGTVVFDEFHYMNDQSRGITWEESIVLSPEHVQLLPLSATVGNAKKIAKWISDVHPSREVVTVNVPPEERHVPLNNYVISLNSPTEIAPLLKGAVSVKNLKFMYNNETMPDRTKMALKQLAEAYENKETVNNGLKTLESLVGTTKSINNAFLKLKMQNDGISETIIDSIIPILIDKKSLTTNKISTNNKQDKKIPKGVGKYHQFNLLLDKLNKKEMLPAISFIFSKKKIDENIEYFSQNGSSLFDINKPEDAKKLSILNNYLNEYEQNEPLKSSHYNREALMKGYAAHHAGMMPSYKQLIEKLFQENLLKVCFATETLQAGINMPAKTVILTDLTKRSTNKYGECEFRELTPNEVQQMAGRAGRRGIDTSGNVIYLCSKDEDVQLAGTLAKSSSSEITSKFGASYSFLLNSLQSELGYKRIDELTEKTFLVNGCKNKDEIKDDLKLQFDRFKNILEDKHYIEKKDDESYNVNEKGKIASMIKGCNELVMTDLIYDGKLADLTPANLAATVSTLASLNDSPLTSNTKTSDMKMMIYTAPDALETRYKEITDILIPEKVNNLNNILNEKEITDLKLINNITLDGKNDLKSLKNSVEEELTKFTNKNDTEFITKINSLTSEIKNRNDLQEKDSYSNIKISMNTFTSLINGLNDTLDKIDAEEINSKNLFKKTSLIELNKNIEFAQKQIESKACNDPISIEDKLNEYIAQKETKLKTLPNASMGEISINKALRETRQEIANLIDIHPKMLTANKIKITVETLKKSNKPEDKTNLGQIIMLSKNISKIKAELEEYKDLTKEINSIKDEISNINTLKQGEVVLKKAKEKFVNYFESKKGLDLELVKHNKEYENYKKLNYVYNQILQIRKLQKEENNINSLIDVLHSDNVEKQDLLSSINNVEEIAIKNKQLEDKNNIPANSSKICFDSEVPLYVWKWAKSPIENTNSTWKQILNEASLNDSIKYEGDLFKVINQTSELLKQIINVTKNIEFKSPAQANKMNKLGDNATEALTILQKPPIGVLPESVNIS